MLLIAFKSLFFVTVILGYSTGILRLINDYFRKEFKDYLHEEVKKNKYLLVDPIKAPINEESPLADGVKGEVKQPSGTVTANRLLDELILNFGRMFTTRNEPERSRKNSDKKTSPSKEDETFPKPFENHGPQNDPVNNVPDPGGGMEPAERDIDPLEKGRAKQPPEIGTETDDTSRISLSAATDDDDEKKWINYWKTRQRGQTDSGDSGYCEPLIDSCERNLPPS